MILGDHFGAARASLGEAYWRKYAATKDQHLTEQAKQECETAITLGNAGAAGHICLGLVYGGTGPYSKSAAQYQLAVQLEPGNESAAIKKCCAKVVLYAFQVLSDEPTANSKSGTRSSFIPTATCPIKTF